MTGIGHPWNFSGIGHPWRARALLLGFTLALVCTQVHHGLAADEPALKITKETVARFPNADAAALIGIRAEAKEAFLVSRDGSCQKVNLENGTLQQEPALNALLVDFALLNGNILGLGIDGKLLGAVPPAWQNFSSPGTSFKGACEINVSEGEMLLGAGVKSYFLGKTATQPVQIANLTLGMPFHDGFLWAVRYHASTRIWNVELVDTLGNKMKRIYRFSRDFEPSGLKIGPLGPEGELLLSFYIAGKRELVLIGQNGRMLWRLQGPVPVICDRDLAWDHQGRLLVLEQDGKDLVLNRWVFVLPQG